MKCKLRKYNEVGECLKFSDGRLCWTSTLHWLVTTNFFTLPFHCIYVVYTDYRRFETSELSVSFNLLLSIILFVHGPIQLMHEGEVGLCTSVITTSITTIIRPRRSR